MKYLFSFIIIAASLGLQAQENTPERLFQIYGQRIKTNYKNCKWDEERPARIYKIPSCAVSTINVGARAGNLCEGNVICSFDKISSSAPELAFHVRCFSDVKGSSESCPSAQVCRDQAGLDYSNPVRVKGSYNTIQVEDQGAPGAK